MKKKLNRTTFSFSIVLLLISLLIGGKVVMTSKQYQEYQLDKAEVSSIRYGILNADAWKQHLSEIITKKVEEFEITPENQEKLQTQLENVMYRLLDEVALILKNDMGAVKRFLVNAFVDLETLRENVPELAQSLLEELSKPENKENIKEYIFLKLDEFVDEIYNLDEQKQLNELIIKYECSDSQTTLTKLEQLNISARKKLFMEVSFLSLILIVIFFINFFQVKNGNYNSYYILLIIVFLFMIVGISTPMINIEAKISRLTFILLGEKIVFTNQVLFFQSKSILDVVWILIKTMKFDMIVVGVLIFSFSVLFPFSKIVCSYITLQNPQKYASNKIVSFFTYKSGKWSMADVFVVAIFMAYIAFNGIVESQLTQMSNSYHNVEILTTNGTKLQFGFYMFLLFCISGLFLSDLIQRNISK